MNKQEVYEYIAERGKLMFPTQETWVDFTVHDDHLYVTNMDIQELEVYAHADSWDNGLIVRSCTQDLFAGSIIGYRTTESINEVFFVINEEFSIYEDDEFVRIYEQTP